MISGSSSFRRQVEKISEQELTELTKDAKLLGSNKLKERKVLLTKDGQIVKLYRLKRLLSSAFLTPYAERFVYGAKKLREIGIHSVEVEHVYYIDSLKRYAIVYSPLPGISLRDFLQKSEELEQRRQTMSRVISFIAELHHKGVYFRSLHFGNILVMPEGGFALIDLAAIRFRRWSLGVWQRARNFKSFLRYPEDYQQVAEFGITEFIDEYIQRAQLSRFASKIFRHLLLLYNPKLKGKYR